MILRGLDPKNPLARTSWQEPGQGFGLNAVHCLEATKRYLETIGDDTPARVRIEEAINALVPVVVPEPAPEPAPPSTIEPSDDPVESPEEQDAETSESN